MSRSLSTRLLSVTAVVAATVLLVGCIPSGPPTPEQVNDRFAEVVEPAWEVEIDGLFGEVVVRDGLVFAYADDEADGMRLEVHSLDDGKLLWEHVSSPGGAYANPILESVGSASRSYPFPSIRPAVYERGDGEDSQLVAMFFERDIPEEESISPDDFLHVADARTGELLDVTFDEFDEYEFRPYGTHDDGQVFANVLSPPFACGDGKVCFDTMDPVDTYASGLLTLDIDALTLDFEFAHFAASDDTVIPEWGPGFAYVLSNEDDRSFVAKYEDGQPIWSVELDDLFGDARSSPPEYVPFVQVGDLVLVQGYQGLLETLDPELPHTLEVDYTAARTLVALDPASGEVLWRAPGVDMHCFAVAERATPSDAESIPACQSTAGSFVYDLEADEFTDDQEIDASIVEVDLSDGSIGWEVPDAGEASILFVSRVGDFAFASGGEYAVGADADGAVQLVNLTNGEALDPVKDATFVCKIERDDVELEFEGSSFAGGVNPLTSGYPAGWTYYPCDAKGEEIDAWSRGGVALAGIGEIGGDGSRVILPLDGSIVAFDVG